MALLSNIAFFNWGSDIPSLETRERKKAGRRQEVEIQRRMAYVPEPFCIDPELFQAIRTDGIWGCLNKYKAIIRNCENKYQMSLGEALPDLCPESQMTLECLDTGKAK